MCKKIVVVSMFILGIDQATAQTILSLKQSDSAVVCREAILLRDAVATLNSDLMKESISQTLSAGTIEITKPFSVSVPAISTSYWRGTLDRVCVTITKQ